MPTVPAVASVEREEMKAEVTRDQSGKRLAIDRKLVWVALLFGCAVLAGGSGYLFGRLSPGSLSALTVQQMPPFEVYLSEHSFSEIENAKDKLQALCTEFLTAVRVSHDASAQSPAAVPAHSNSLYVVAPEKAIRELERGLEQFKGTEQETKLIHELLAVLNIQKIYGRWLDVYLAALYEHPTDDLIGQYAKDALAIANTLGRQAEVINAFALLRRIPLSFAAKMQIQDTLEGDPLTQLDSGPQSAARPPAPSSPD